MNTEKLRELERAQDGCPLARELAVLRGMCACRGDDAAIAEAEDEYLRLTARLRAAEGLAEALRQVQAAKRYSDDSPSTVAKIQARIDRIHEASAAADAALAEWEKSK